MKRIRYQKGSLALIARKDGTKVWQYRYRENKPDATRVGRKIIVGRLKDLPTESLAWKAVAPQSPWATPTESAAYNLQTQRVFGTVENFIEPSARLQRCRSQASQTLSILLL